MSLDALQSSIPGHSVLKFENGRAGSKKRDIDDSRGTGHPYKRGEIRPYERLARGWLGKTADTKGHSKGGKDGDQAGGNNEPRKGAGRTRNHFENNGDRVNDIPEALGPLGGLVHTVNADLARITTMCER